MSSAASFSTSVRTSLHARKKQNWVIDPLQDMLFIIAAPLIFLGLAVALMHYYGAGPGAAMVITAHIVLTVAHHLPTFIRIYGDVDLFKRFKWNFVLGPIIPIAFSIAVLGYINYHQYPVEYFLYLYIFLALWDPWHFLRQHFGFMRIYDRHNLAPVKLASNMDWAICTIWFVHIMVASVDWIPGLLEDLYRNAHIPLLLVLPENAINVAQGITWWLAVFASGAYGLYLGWCAKSGYYISGAKLALLICTFGVMYFTYTPNEWILQLVPAWSFKVGFATVGIVHMTQYLAIVWRYDRRIAEQGRARQDWFQWLHSRRTPLGIALAAIVYVGACLAYGNVITTSFDNRWFMSVLLAVGFTSTLMHYYFDGFIWRVRHQQNRDALGLSGSDSSASLTENTEEQKPAVSSWWSNVSAMTAGKMFARQLLYFGLPMGILTLGAVSVWKQGNVNYVQQMYQAQTLSQQGEADAAILAARQAFASMQNELPVIEKLARFKPSASNEAQLAFLIYNESLYNNIIMPKLDGKSSSFDQQHDHLNNVRRASDLLMSAVYRGGDLAHPGRESLTHEESRSIALSWQRQLQ